LILTEAHVPIGITAGRTGWCI